MHARIEKVGDGFGLRLPKRLLESCGLGEDVSVTVRDKTLVIAPAPSAARAGWAEAIQNIPQEALDRDYEELQAFREMPERGTSGVSGRPPSTISWTGVTAGRTLFPLPIKWIAARVRIGSSKGAKSVLHCWVHGQNKTTAVQAKACAQLDSADAPRNPPFQGASSRRRTADLFC